MPITQEAQPGLGDASHPPASPQPQLLKMMGVLGVRGEGPTPSLAFNPPLLGGRARARGADKGAGAWPGARAGGPSPPPIHRRGSA